MKDDKPQKKEANTASEESACADARWQNARDCFGQSGQQKNKEEEIVSETKRNCIVCDKPTLYFTDNHLPLCTSEKCRKKVEVAYAATVGSHNDFLEVLKRM